MKNRIENKIEKTVYKKDGKYWNGTEFSASIENAKVFDDSNHWNAMEVPALEGIESEVID